MKVWKQIDSQDVCLLVGVLSLIVGAGMVYRPAGVLTAGILSLLAAFLIERAKGRK